MKSSLLVVVISAALAAACFPTYAGPYEETRYIEGPIIRNADGTIKRDQKVVEEFKKLHPKPSADLLGAPCDVWEADHVVSLACGGVDAVSNMQWLPTCLKRIKKYGKDSWERKVYGGFVDDSICTRPGG